jgi:hypothetical protein
VNRSKSPSTERVPLDLFSRAVPDDDVLAVPKFRCSRATLWFISERRRGRTESRVHHRHCRSDLRFHIQRRCQFMCAVFRYEILDWDSFDGLSSAMVLPLVGV